MPMRLAGAMTLGAALVLICCCGPFDDDNVVSEEVLCHVKILGVADSTDAGAAIIVRIAGIVGPDSCYRLERIERESIGRRWVLRPIAHHLVRPCACCPRVVVYFDEFVSLGPADSGWIFVEAESAGPLLADSTYVRPPSAPVDTFTYMCYYLEVPAVTGWFTTERTGPHKISGEWHFSYVGEPVEVGPQVGDGILAGTVEGDHIVINLNPGWQDANVYLDGVLTGDRYLGDWTFSSLAGIVSQGPFEATRR